MEKVAGRMAAKLKPEYFSVTYGAGGSTRERTYATVERLCQNGLTVAPHLSFGLDDKQTVKTLLDNYLALDIRHLVALSGDLPDGAEDGQRIRRAVELMHFIRSHYGDHFCIHVAAYPEVHPAASSAEADLRWFKTKVEAGANTAITQFFYNCDAYENFMNRCARAGVKIPVVPGIMPITSYDGLLRISEKCGAQIPRWILKQIEQYQDDLDSLRSFGVEVVTALCERLQALGAPGIHFYALNRLGAVMKICDNLGLLDHDQLAAD